MPISERTAVARMMLSYWFSLGLVPRPTVRGLNSVTEINRRSPQDFPETIAAVKRGADQEPSSARAQTLPLPIQLHNNTVYCYLILQMRKSTW